MGRQPPQKSELLAVAARGPDIGQLPGTRQAEVGSPEMLSLRERIAEQYSAPFDVIFDSPQAAAELNPVDRSMAFALLIGPLAFGRISTLSDFDYRAVANRRRRRISQMLWERTDYLSE